MLFAGVRVYPAVERPPQALGQDQVSCCTPGVVVLPRNVEVNATHDVIIPGVLQRGAPLVDQGDQDLVVEEGGIPDPCPDDVGGRGEELPRGVLVHPQRDRGLDLAQPLRRLEDDVGHVVGDVVPFGVEAAQGDALQLLDAPVDPGDHGGKPHPGLLELDQQVLRQLDRFVPGQPALGQVLLVEGIEEDIQPAAAGQVCKFDLALDKVDEPEELECLVQRLGGILRNPLANPGYLLQFGSALGIVFGRCHLPGLLGVALAEFHRRVQGDDHRLQEIVLLQVVLGDGVDDLGQPVLGLLFEPLETDPEELFEVGHGAFIPQRPQEGPLELEVLGQISLEGHLVEVAQGFAFPVVENLLHLGPALVVEDLTGIVGVHRPVGRLPVDLDGVIKLVGALSRVAHNALVRGYEDGQVPEYMGQTLPTPEHRGLALGLLIGFGEQAVPDHIELDAGAVHAAHVLVGVVALAHVPGHLDRDALPQLAKVVAQIGPGRGSAFLFRRRVCCLSHILFPSLGWWLSIRTAARSGR